MGLSVSPNPKCWQSSLLSSPKPPASVHSSSSLRNLTHIAKTTTLPYPLFHRSPSRGFKNFRTQRVTRVRSADSDDLFDEEMMNLIKEVARAFDQSEDEDVKSYVPLPEDTQNREVKTLSSSEKFLTMKPDLLEPSQLGIEPEPPSWPERDELLKLRIARKLNGVGLPLSIRMIKKKLQWQKGLQEASDFTYCSVKKTFSSMLFIIHEIQHYALQVSETLYYEDLRDAMNKVRTDVDASFVWLFQKVFWKSPSLMLYMMVLLANFSVYSMGNHTVVSVTPSSVITEVQNVSESKNNKKGLKEEEEALWNSIIQEASRLHDGKRSEDLEKETMKQFVSPESVEIEEDKYEEYASTDFYYKKYLFGDPNNSLLLSNYAMFLYLVVRDNDLAEKYFRQSVSVKPADPEAFSRYGDFLWLAKNDLWGAETRYLQAIEEDKGNPHHTSKYASFLWNTGGDDTCYPIYYRDDTEQQ
ncbi:uncharacterized protein G2W53_030310 [Senna tora]|uniref:Uncharacterized protein n=1 Tax=Senna tora TaxID=362788 RepID=A0A834T787_9FABA|nr:uncharacterized protein G2W53_030310 [Senna tora]